MNTVITPTATKPVSNTPSTFSLDAPAPCKGWAYAGIAAGVGAIAFFMGPATQISSSREAYADNVDVLAEIDGKHPWVWAFQVGSVALAILVVLFGVGLRRRLAGQEPAGSLVPDLALIGLVLVAVMLLVGGGISTELFHALRHADESDPDTIAGQLTIFNTMAWVWAGGLLTTGAVAVAGRHGSVGRGVGRFALAMSVLVIATQVVPLQYLAVLPVALFLIVCGVSMVRSETSVGKFGATNVGSDV